MKFDVLFVGGWPSMVIVQPFVALMQRAPAKRKRLVFCLVEKVLKIGAHILLAGR